MDFSVSDIKELLITTDKTSFTRWRETLNLIQSRVSIEKKHDVLYNV